MRRLMVLPVSFALLACSDTVTPPIGIAVVDARTAFAVSTWVTLAPTLEGPRFLPGVAADASGRIHVFGGQFLPGFGPKASAEVYDATTNTWSFITPLPVARTNQATALGGDGRIYHVAGLVQHPTVPGSFVSTNTVIAYDPATNTYSSAPPFPGVDRFSLSGAAGLDGRVYVAGGNSGALGGQTAQAAVYDPATSAWTMLPPMPTTRIVFAMATGPSGRIYAIGGRLVVGSTVTILADVHAYDPVTNAWSSVASMPGPRAFHAAARGVDGRIYVFGGSGTSGLLTDAYAYEEAANTWSQIPALNVPRRAGMGALGGDGRVYAVGGTSPTDVPPTEALELGCTQSPTVSLTVSPATLWPPNHTLHTVATNISASDDCGTPSLVVSVASNEPANGPGDGSTSADWIVTDNGNGTFNVAVRAERSGGGSGRVYTITATATDGDGNVTVASGTVTVLRNK